jgi:hypothetical protein
MVRALAAVLALTAVAPAVASEPSDRGVAISYVVEPDGRGMLVGYPTPDAWGSVTWERCAPDGSPCEAFASDPASDQIVHVGDAEPGTVFQATASGNGTTITARSDPYGGPIHAVVLPRIDGALRVGALVKPVPARWTGGWGGEVPVVQLQVCRDRKGGDCRVISDYPYWDDCPGVGAVLQRRYEGWYLRVADARSARTPAFPAFAALRPEDLTPFLAAPNVATAIVGRIGAPAGPPESHCGALPAPTVSLYKRVSRRGVSEIALVRCKQPCRAVATVRQGAVRITVTRSAPDGTLALSEREVARLHRGRASVVLRVDDRRRASGTIQVA